MTLSILQNISDALQNVFIKSIVVPVIFTFIGAIAEFFIQTQKGVSQGERKYKIWFEKLSGNQTEIDFRVESIDSLLKDSKHQQSRSALFKSSREASKVIHVENLVGYLFTDFQWSDYGSVAINLVIGAFSIDVASLLNKESNQPYTAFVLMSQILCLLAIFIFLGRSAYLNPKQELQKNTCVRISIYIGLFSMIIAFLSTSRFN